MDKIHSSTWAPIYSSWATVYTTLGHQGLPAPKVPPQPDAWSDQAFCTACWEHCFVPAMALSVDKIRLEHLVPFAERERPGRRVVDFVK